MKGLDLALAFVGGAVAGAAAALLLAPEKGSETRKAIKDFIKEHCPAVKRNALEEIADEIADQIEDERKKRL